MAEMETPTAHGVSRVMAARTILELSLKAAERVDHSERLREIEADVAAGKALFAKLQGQGDAGQGVDCTPKYRTVSTPIGWTGDALRTLRVEDIRALNGDACGCRPLPGNGGCVRELPLDRGIR